MTQTDEEFFRHLHKQIAEQQRDKNLTTMRVLERRKKQKPPSNNQKPKSK